MLSWRGAVVGSDGVGRDDIMLLLDDRRIVPGASSGTALDQQVMQVDQRRHRHARRASGHSGTGDRIQHPGRHDQDNARLHLDMNKLAGNALFTVVPPNPTPMERVPAVVDLDLRPDMGRMTPRLPSAESHGSSSARIAAVAALRSSTP
jgi:hypothetical protein